MGSSGNGIGCPACGGSGDAREGVGDLVVCGACGVRYWAVEGAPAGRLLKPAEKPAPSAVVVVSLHAGVLAAETVLALAMAGALVGLPLWGIGRLSGFL